MSDQSPTFGYPPLSPLSDERLRAVERLSLTAAVYEAIRAIEIKNMAAELLVRREADRWHPIETAPRQERVLVLSSDGMRRVGKLVPAGRGGSFKWMQDGGFGLSGATHWRPLPRGFADHQKKVPNLYHALPTPSEGAQ
jgi:hypothetical protein